MGRKKYIPLRTVAATLEKHPQTVRRWLHSGLLPGYFIGERLVVCEDDLRDFIRPLTPDNPVRPCKGNK